MWNPKTELAKEACKIAKKKHPEGFNKAQLIECGKEVFDGFGETQTNPLVRKKIKTMEDVNNMGNAMAQIDGHYPVGMSGCFVVGLNGGCGPDCPVYLEGDCEELGDVAKDLTGEALQLHQELYGDL